MLREYGIPKEQLMRLSERTLVWVRSSGKV